MGVMSTNYCFVLQLSKSKLEKKVILRTMIRTVARAAISPTTSHPAVPARICGKSYATYGGRITNGIRLDDVSKKIDYHPKIVEVIEVDDHPYFPKGTCVIVGSFTKKPLKDVLKYTFYPNHLLDGTVGKTQYLTCPKTHIRILDMKAFRIDTIITEAINNHPETAAIVKWYGEHIHKTDVIWVVHIDSDPNLYKSVFNTYKKIPLDEGF